MINIDRKEDIRFVIDQSKYQNELYRKLEKEDEKYRKSIDSKIVQKDHKIEANLEEIKKKNEKDVQRINKHLGEVYKKHVDL